MTGHVLIRARLRRDVPLRAIAPLLVPDDPAARIAASHRLVWSLLGDGPDRTRDFLWREEADGRFLILSARAPAADHPLFEVESKPFAPVLAAGDRLRFVLRANATLARAVPGQRGHRTGVATAAVKALPPEDRAAMRHAAIRQAGMAWLARTGARCGFTPDPGCAVDGDDHRRITRTGGSAIETDVLDFDGALGIDDPALFLAALRAGFGRARAFGCGLMLIRRG